MGFDGVTRDSAGDIDDFIGINRGEEDIFSIFSMVFQAGASGDAISIGADAMVVFSTILVVFGAGIGVGGGDGGCTVVVGGEGGGVSEYNPEQLIE